MMSSQTTTLVGPSIDGETLSYIRRVRSTATATTTNDVRQDSQDHAIDAFHKAFHIWNPTSMICIKPCDKMTLDVVFDNSEGLDMSMLLNQEMVEFKKYIANLVKELCEQMKVKEKYEIWRFAGFTCCDGIIDLGELRKILHVERLCERYPLHVSSGL